jgi:hypothetical protein
MLFEPLFGMWVTDKPHASVAYLLGKAPHIHLWASQSVCRLQIIKISWSLNRRADFLSTVVQAITSFLY